MEHGVEHQLHGAGTCADDEVDARYGLHEALPGVVAHAFDGGQQVDECLLARCVEGRGGLIGDKNFGPADQYACRGDVADPLLASGGEGDEIPPEQFDAAALGYGHAAMRLSSVLLLPPDGPCRKTRSPAAISRRGMSRQGVGWPGQR